MIAVVDDDPLFRAFLREALQLAGFEVVEFERGEDLLRATAAPDAAVVDVTLDGISGYEVCRALRDRLGQRFPILLVSGERCESGDRVAGLLIGADDYLVKPFAVDELVARIHRRLVHARSEPSSTRGGPESDGARRQMSRRELEVLQSLALGRTQRDIAAELFISSNTVATHIQRILEKLGAHSRAEAVSIAYRLGLVSL